MRRAALAVATVLLLAGPTVVAFYSGGFFTEPRLIAAIVAWLVVLLLALAGPLPLPRSAPGWLAVGGFVVLVAWSALSITWAPLRGPATGDVERLLLYLAALLVAVGMARERGVVRLMEPALAAGTVIVIGYGLSGRLLPGIVHLAHSLNAGGRLEQPITYWNSEGALAAIGFVLCARLAGDPTRPRWMRIAAAAASGPLGAGIYLSYSRGAIAAAAVGLVVLVAAVPVRAQLRAAGLVLVAGVVAAAVSSAFPGVASLHGGPGSRESDGAIVFVLFAVVAGAAALAQARLSARERDDAQLEPESPVVRRRVAIALSIVLLVTAGLIVGGLREKVSAAKFAGANASRLTTVSSNRYQYWRIGARAFIHHPLDGLGTSGFRVYWLEQRPIRESVQNVHSIELETAAELGIVGLLALGALLGGVGWAAARALRANAPLAAGLMAGALVWLLHASIDWDWQLPAVTLPAIALAGALIALGERPAEA
ncbi:MAG TPA: O-antigen ligase family protein [Thermoleophilaceae bacterium]